MGKKKGKKEGEASPTKAPEKVAVAEAKEEKETTKVESAPLDVASTKESLEAALKRRPSLLEVEGTANIAPAGRRMSAKLSAVAVELEKNIIKDDLGRKVESRPDVEEMKDANIVRRTSVAPALQGIASALEHSIKSNAVGASLERRPSVTALAEAGILKTNVAPAIQAKVAELEKNITKDGIGQLLETRPDASDLIASGILDDKIAPRLQEIQNRLSRAMAKDAVQHYLQSRPDASELIDRNILKASALSKGIMGAAADLERSMMKDALAAKISSRPLPSDLFASRVIKEETFGLASNLHSARNQLETNLLKARLKERIENRPSADQLRAVIPRIFSSPAKAVPPPYNPKTVVYASNFDNSESETRTVLRTRYAIALKAAARLASTGQITADEKGRLKELILDHDKRIFGAIEVYELDHDAGEMLDTLYRVAKLD